MPGSCVTAGHLIFQPSKGLKPQFFSSFLLHAPHSPFVLGVMHALSPQWTPARALGTEIASRFQGHRVDYRNKSVQSIMCFERQGYLKFQNTQKHEL